jgi:hypothetical protein
LSVDAAFLESPAVKKWREGLRNQSGVAVSDDDERLTLLADFCREMGESPEELIEFCFLRKREDGTRFLSAKRRRELAKRIDEFVRSTGLEGHAFVVAANRIRSFLIHNGVFMGAVQQQ